MTKQELELALGMAAFYIAKIMRTCGQHGTTCPIKNCNGIKKISCDKLITNHFLSAARKQLKGRK